MSKVIGLEYGSQHLSTGDNFEQVSKVTVKGEDGKSYDAGNDSGRSLTIETPWASQSLANRLQKDFARTDYLPFTANGAAIDPDYELGDDVMVGNDSSRVFSRELNFDSLMNSNIGAPGEDELDHEFPHRSKKDRKQERKDNHLGGGIRKNQEDLDGFYKEFVGRYDELSGGLTTLGKKTDEKLEVVTATFAKIGKDIEATNELIATETKERKTATATLKAAVDGKVAKLTLSAEKITASGKTRTLAQLLADVIELQGNVKILGSLEISGGRLLVKAPIVTDDTVYCNVVSIVSATGLHVGGYTYTPTEITSTSGSKYNVLGR